MMTARKSVPASGRAWLLVFSFCTAALTASPATAQGNLVVIEGGPDQSGHNYDWTVTNQHDSPIVEIEFPHFSADLFTPPDGWRQETTFLVNIGVAEKVGVCKAIAPSPASGIAPGQSTLFKMRATGKGADRGFATVTVRFANGDTQLVKNVPLPQREDLLSRFVGLLGLVAVLGVVILVRTLRGRKGDQSAKTDSPEAS